MTTKNEETKPGRPPATPPRPRRASEQTTVAQPVSSAVNSSPALVTTTEIPVTIAHPRTSRPTRDEYYDDDWRYDGQRREPAPVALRIAVWFLFFIFVLALIGLAIVHYHPTWVSFLRQSSSLSPLLIHRAHLTLLSSLHPGMGI